jgi:large subunit ribosomal protein L25
MTIELKAEPRTITGKKVSQLRRQAVIPIVIYGGGVNEPISAQVSEKELGLVLHRAGTSHLIDINISGLIVPGLAREVQHDQMTKRITHVDFQAVRMDQPVVVAVPVRMIGESAAVADGAVLTHPTDSVEIEALPRNLVSHIDLDISAIKEVGDMLKVSDLIVPAKVTIKADPDMVLVISAAPMSEAALEESLEGEAEPELVGRDKDTEEQADEE